MNEYILALPLFTSKFLQDLCAFAGRSKSLESQNITLENHHGQEWLLIYLSQLQALFLAVMRTSRSDNTTKFVGNFFQFGAFKALEVTYLKGLT